MERRKRTHRVQVRLNDNEYDFLKSQIKRTGLTTEAYLRKIIANKTPKTKEFAERDRDIIAQLNAIGNNLNQISRRANTMGIINIDSFSRAIKLFEKTMSEFFKEEE